MAERSNISTTAPEGTQHGRRGLPSLLVLVSSFGFHWLMAGRITLWVAIHFIALGAAAIVVTEDWSGRPRS